MKKNLSKLVNVKSLVTLAIIAVFCYLAIRGRIQTENVMVVVTLILTFYFAKPDKKEVETEYIKPEISE